MTVQYRDHPAELRHRTEGEHAVIEGYASVFNSYSQNLGGFVEEILPGAFTNSITQKASSTRADIRGTYNHRQVIARQHNGSLRTSEDNQGLHFEIDLNLRITAHRDLLESVEGQLVNGASFGFEMLDWEWSHTQEGFPLLRQKAVELFDEGPVDFPAYLDTDVDRVRMYRSYAEQVAECEDTECFVSRAVAAYSDTRKFDLSDLIEERQDPEPEPAASTPLLDAARQRLADMQTR